MYNNIKRWNVVKIQIIKLIIGVWTCINCGLVQGSQIIYG